LSLKIVKPGVLSTIQDTGRRGYQKFGIIESGAMDHFALKAANILVGNVPNEAVIESTILGPTIYFDAPTLISICGGDFTATINGHVVPQWRPVFLEEGSILKMGSAKTGIRAYIAVSGGFDLPKEMDSRSTYLRAGIGGFHGRALQAGDVLNPRQEIASSIVNKFQVMADNEKPFMTSSKFISIWARPNYSSNPYIRVIKGAQFDLFTEESKVAFFNNSFKVLPDSDRMGYRLEGKPLELTAAKEMVSEAVSFGTIQVPSNGQPIVLMADHQTTGGYPKIAHVISVDLPLMAQLNFGSEVRFKEVSLQEAHANRSAEVRNTGACLGYRRF
jgi:antagonist of KipI